MGFWDMGVAWVSLERVDRAADTRGYSGRFVRAEPPEASLLKAVLVVLLLPGALFLCGSCLAVNAIYGNWPF